MYVIVIRDKICKREDTARTVVQYFSNLGRDPVSDHESNMQGRRRKLQCCERC